jgi:hypothetical protein
MEKLKQKNAALNYTQTGNYCLNPRRSDCANFVSGTIINISKDICEVCIWKKNSL